MPRRNIRRVRRVQQRNPHLSRHKKPIYKSTAEVLEFYGTSTPEEKKYMQDKANFCFELINVGQLEYALRIYHEQCRESLNNKRFELQQYFDDLCRTPFISEESSKIYDVSIPHRLFLVAVGNELSVYYRHFILSLFKSNCPQHLKEHIYGQRKESDEKFEILHMVLYHTMVKLIEYGVDFRVVHPKLIAMFCGSPDYIKHPATNIAHYVPIFLELFSQFIDDFLLYRKHNNQIKESFEKSLIFFFQVIMAFKGIEYLPKQKILNIISHLKKLQITLPKVDLVHKEIIERALQSGLEFIQKILEKQLEKAPKTPLDIYHENIEQILFKPIFDLKEAAALYTKLREHYKDNYLKEPTSQAKQFVMLILKEFHARILVAKKASTQAETLIAEEASKKRERKYKNIRLAHASRQLKQLKLKKAQTKKIQKSSYKHAPIIPFKTELRNLEEIYRAQSTNKTIAECKRLNVVISKSMPSDTFLLAQAYHYLAKIKVFTLLADLYLEFDQTHPKRIHALEDILSLGLICTKFADLFPAVYSEIATHVSFAKAEHQELFYSESESSDDEEQVFERPNIEEKTKIPASSVKKLKLPRPLNIPKSVQDVIRLLNSGENKVFIYGGAARNHLLCQPVNDYDLLSSMTIKDVMTVCTTNNIPAKTVGHNHPIVQIDNNGEKIDVTCIELAEDPRSDLAKYTRQLDYLSNSLFLIPENKGHVRYYYDCFSGKATASIRDKDLQLIDKTGEILERDPVVLLRGLRLAAQHGFTIHKTLENLFKEKAALLSNVPADRMYHEIVKTLCCKDAGVAFDLLAAYGIVEQLFKFSNNPMFNKAIKPILAEYSNTHKCSAAYLLAMLLLPQVIRNLAETRSVNIAIHNTLSEQHSRTSFSFIMQKKIATILLGYFAYSDAYPDIDFNIEELWQLISPEETNSETWYQQNHQLLFKALYYANQLRELLPEALDSRVNLSMS